MKTLQMFLSAWGGIDDYRLPGLDNVCGTVFESVADAIAWAKSKGYTRGEVFGYSPEHGTIVVWAYTDVKDHEWVTDNVMTLAEYAELDGED